MLIGNSINILDQNNLVFTAIVFGGGIRYWILSSIKNNEELPGIKYISILYIVFTCLTSVDIIQYIF